MDYKKAFLRTLGLVGSLFFIPLFLFTFLNPHTIEKAGRSFVEFQLEQEVSSKIESLTLPKASRLEIALGQKAKELREQTEQRIKQIQHELKSGLPQLLAQQLSAMKNLDCECRLKWQKRIQNFKLGQLQSLEQARRQLTDFTQTKYMEIVSQLTLDVRVFLAANSVLFLLILLLSLAKPQAINHLLLPSVLMVISTAICSYFYLFEQNWFYTILYNDYTGLAFVGYLLIVFAVLCDITLNKSRITTNILNGILNVIGSSASLAPC